MNQGTVKVTMAVHGIGQNVDGTPTTSPVIGRNDRIGREGRSEIRLSMHLWSWTNGWRRGRRII
jgi:hypothetical protein